MRSDRVWLGILAVVAALLVAPCSALAQTATDTDAAIAELRQLLADQRAAVDRQARTIEEQGQRLAALQERVEGTNRSTEERLALAGPATTTTAVAAVGTQAPLSQQPTSRTAAEPTPDLPTIVVSAGEFPGSIRIPGTESAFKLGGEARLVAVHTLSALGTEDRFVTSSIPVGVPRAGDEARTVYTPIASRLSTELRMPSERGPMRLFIESDFAGAGRTMRFRHAFLQTNRFVAGQTCFTFSDPEAEGWTLKF
jgi:Sec-independent protein translocase protein TatA